MFNIRTSLVNDNILYFEFRNIKEENISLFRMSEFYESPHKEINSKIFTFEDFLISYTKSNGKLTFFSDWPAYNLPGHIIEEFQSKFQLTKSEELILSEIDKNINRTKPYYVIASLRNDKGSFLHELAHAFYYLNAEYNNEMNKLLKEVPMEITLKLRKGFKKIGYPLKIKSIIKDETQSWLATSDKEDFKDEFDFDYNEVKATHFKFKKVFLKYKYDIISKNTDTL